MAITLRCCFGSLLFVVWLFNLTVGAAEPQPSYAAPYDPLLGSIETYERHEALRRRDIALQLMTIEQLKWRGVLSPFDFSGLYAFDDSPWHSRPPVGSPYGWSSGWGDPWGFPWHERTRQPIGRIEVQTGPNRWESHPVYARRPEKFDSPASPVEALPTPPPDRSPGPREF